MAKQSFGKRFTPEQNDRLHAAKESGEAAGKSVREGVRKAFGAVGKVAKRFVKESKNLITGETGKKFEKARIKRSRKVRNNSSGGGGF